MDEMKTNQIEGLTIEKVEPIYSFSYTQAGYMAEGTTIVCLYENRLLVKHITVYTNGAPSSEVNYIQAIKNIARVDFFINAKEVKVMINNSPLIQTPNTIENAEKVKTLVALLEERL